jgi:hypothetical protein
MQTAGGAQPENRKSEHRQKLVRCDFLVTILGPLLVNVRSRSREQFEAARKRLKATLNGVVTMDKRDLERLITEVRWLKERLRRVEYALEPLVESLR